MKLENTSIESVIIFIQVKDSLLVSNGIIINVTRNEYEWFK